MAKIRAKEIILFDEINISSGNLKKDHKSFCSGSSYMLLLLSFYDYVGCTDKTGLSMCEKLQGLVIFRTSTIQFYPCKSLRTQHFVALCQFRNEERCIG